jgi:hypothetical protein
MSFSRAIYLRQYHALELGGHASVGHQYRIGPESDCLYGHGLLNLGSLRVLDKVNILVVPWR